jgi:hypothetical protein
MTEFSEIWSMMGNGAILGRTKSQSLYQELLKTKNVPGVMAEIGVYKGNTAKLMRLTIPEKTLYLYDTFTGLVNSDPSIDVHKDGEFCDTSFEAVSRLIGFSLVVYRVGKFPDTFTQRYQKFSFVHSDTDTYIGTRKTLELIIPRLSTGGILIFDDYEWPNCPGVKKAIDEFLLKNTRSITTMVGYYQFIIRAN